MPASRKEGPGPPEKGTGVDRTLIRQRLALTPAQRVRLAVREARNLQAFRERLPK
ncbi:MAG: hypothetical protein KY459_04270 [Acidobacteria bacterium]|nr:hypothetical protein [Acidobacteriota bacterium]